MEYVIVYTNGRTVQEHRLYYLVRKVNVFLQGNVKRVIPTSPIQISTVGSITKSVSYLVINFIIVGNCWV